MRLTPRAAAVPLSRTLALDARAKALAATGRDVVNMTAGEPDFDSPEVVRAAAKRIVDEGRVRYTPAAGRADLRAAVAAHLERTRGVPYEAAEVTVCHSAKHALSGTLLALVDAGDEVLMPLPAWTSYEAMVQYAGGVPVGVPPRADMGLDLAALEAAITPRTVGVLVNSPNNPSGWVATRAETEALCELARAHDLWIVSDEIYSRLVYEGEPFVSPVQCGADARARTLVVDGASKAFAMTGYRIGFVAGDRAVANTVANLHSQLVGAPNAVGQDAFQAALVAEPPEVEAMAREFDARRRHVLARLEALGLETPRPRGAFYVFPSIRGQRFGGDADAFCEALLEEEGLAIVPGTAFGLDGHVRLSYATSMQIIDAGLERLARFLSR
ncbi:MAG: pyridoxal phosphate-dependent aminotransferase [Planctomycetes bacterium]|nr:pyridoxal phosphate-dependent aminotransferase [Planctomycetota bacterium]